MDKLHTDVLRILEADSRITAAQIAVMLKKPVKEISAAIADLEAKGVIVKYALVVNTEKLEREAVEALIEVKVSPQAHKGFDAIAEDILQFEEVKSLYLMSGGYDLVVFAEGRTLKEVAMFVSEKLSTIDKVLSTATHFILKKYKSSGAVFSDPSESQRLSVHV